MPEYGVPVLNERAVRAAAGILFFFAMVSFMNAWLTGNFAPTRVFVVAFVLEFALRLFAGEVRDFAHAHESPHGERLVEALERLEAVSGWLLEQAKSDPNSVGAASVEYLHLFGYVAYAYMWARMAAVAQSKRSGDDAFYGGKLATAEFFFTRLLPRTLSLEASIRAGSQPLYGLAAEQF